jgi:hypothetical protein
MISSNDPHQKVRAEHLKRDAYLYIRQSTLQQVLHNTESTQRQYALKQRAIALGWPTEHVNIIDGDQGQSGASAADREGFQKLVAEVGTGHQSGRAPPDRPTTGELHRRRDCRRDESSRLPNRNEAGVYP